MIKKMNEKTYSLLTTGKIKYKEKDDEEEKTIFQFWRNLFKRFSSEIEKMRTC